MTTAQEQIESITFLAKTAEINDANKLLSVTKKIDKELSSTNAQVAVNGGMFKMPKNTDSSNGHDNTNSFSH